MFVHFMWRSFSYFIWKDEQGLLPSFYFPFCFWKAVSPKLKRKNIWLFRRKILPQSLDGSRGCVITEASSFQNEQNTVQSLLRFCNKCVHFFKFLDISWMEGMYVRMCIYYIYDIYFWKMFALLYLILGGVHGCNMKMGHSGTAGQGTLSPCALKGQIFSSQRTSIPKWMWWDLKKWTEDNSPGCFWT